MPLIAAGQLEHMVVRLLQGAGVGAGEAEIVARHCVAANLAGHDSHGIIQIPQIFAQMKRGFLVPGAPFEVVQETPTTTVIDGHWGFGFVVTERAMRTTIEKARQHRVAACTVRRQGHIGRLTDYALMAAEAGMIGMLTADSGRGPKSVAPFGGRARRLGTNPICIAVPSNLDAPLYIDIATSAVAAGKVNLAVQSGSEIPYGWVIDKDGCATTDPTALARGGALLPLGGSEGHKGYGLGVVIEIFSGILTGLGFGVEPSGHHNDGSFIAVFDVAAFYPLEDFKQQVTSFARDLIASPAAEGFSRVYYPGEIEHLKTQQHLADGLHIDDRAWKNLTDLAQEFGLGDLFTV